jgi:uncharacterized protein (TIGR00375 family)
LARVYADLHVHSKYSAATSLTMDLEHMAYYSKFKGLKVVATGDVLHPKWVAELRQKLTDVGGLFLLDGRPEGPLFVLSGEVSTIYEDRGEVKRLHHVVLYPSFDDVDSAFDALKDHGNLASDGRPVLSLSSEELLATLVRIDERIELFPAHIWTPHYSLFGLHGYRSVQDAFGAMSSHVHALETGLSSDPEMNWTLSALDSYLLVSNSDSHSPYPWRLGREANLFDLRSLDYDSLLQALRREGPSSLIMTVETYPEYGKYHWPGHRACNFSVSPEEYVRLKGICPKCGKRLTTGVDLEVLQRADRPRGSRPKGAADFVKVIPLSEIIAESIGSEPSAAKVWKIYRDLVDKFGDEYAVLISASPSDVEEVAGEDIANTIKRMRDGTLQVKPGYDGVYGELVRGQRRGKSLGRFI